MNRLVISMKIFDTSLRRIIIRMSSIQSISYLRVQGNHAVLYVTCIYNNGPQMKYTYWKMTINVVLSKFWAAIIIFIVFVKL